jgi:hypothetical protein
VLKNFPACTVYTKKDHIVVILFVVWGGCTLRNLIRTACYLQILLNIPSVLLKWVELSNRQARLLKAFYDPVINQFVKEHLFKYRTGFRGYTRKLDLKFVYHFL